MRSATIFRSWPFSRSISFRRLAEAVGIPPTSWRQRESVRPSP
jgi:hypothetical protein